MTGVQTCALPIYDGGGGGGEAGTHGDCTGEGCSGDTPGGDGGGGGGLRTVHWSQVEVRTRAQIRPEDYPRAALEMGLPDARCVVRIEIDTRGVPVAVTPKECPTVFGPAAQAIGLRYRFYPLLDDHRRAIPAAFDLAINFRKP